MTVEKRESHKTMSESHKTNMCGKRKHEGDKLVMLAIKLEMRENLDLVHFVLLYKHV